MKKSKDELLDDDYNVNIFRYASKNVLLLLPLFYFFLSIETCNMQHDIQTTNIKLKK